MKKIVLAAMLQISAAAFCFAGQPSLIRGTWKREGSEKTIRLFKVTHGRLEEIASSLTEKGGEFGFYFTPQYEGNYVIGTGAAQTTMDKYSFYFKGGDELNVSVNDSSYTLTGKNSRENIEITKWHDQLQPLEWKAVYFMRSNSTYVDFFPDLQKFNQTVMKKPVVATGNKVFDQLFRERREFDLVFIATSFLFTPRAVHPSKEELLPYYKELHLQQFLGNTALLQYEFGNHFITNLQMVPMMTEGPDAFKKPVEEQLALASNDTMKGELLLLSLRSLKSYPVFDEVNRKYGKYIVTEDQKKRLTEFVAALTKGTLKPGTPAIDFTYPDLAGKKVSLSDFKGKVVLIDVWATWCGPCKGEIPSLKEMEKEMHDKDIVFMSVSVDEAKDEQKWKDFVKKEDLRGVQLFASGWSEIAKYYEIKGIPRFIVVDKKGNIVSADGPRPSGTELKALLDSELKK